jgi:hypothetical protein
MRLTPFMPTPALAAVLATVLAATMARAEGRPPEPVCRLPTVVNVMAQELHGHWYYARIDPALIQETPTPDGELIHCGVCVKIDMYDMGRYGDRPVGRCALHMFSVQAVRNGFVVRYLQ